MARDDAVVARDDAVVARDDAVVAQPRPPVAPFSKPTLVAVFVAIGLLIAANNIGFANLARWVDDQPVRLLAFNSTNKILITVAAVSYTHLRAHETVLDLVCRLLLENKTQVPRHRC